MYFFSDIVHRDLKLENILLAPNPEDSNDPLYIKVTDFGLGIIRGGYHEMLHDRCGTLTYLCRCPMLSRKVYVD